MFCDHGLAPPPKEVVEQGIEGKIFYKGTFPPNITTHYLFASQVYRQFRDINEILNLIFTTDSIKLYTPSLPTTRIDSINFRFVLSPSSYKYIAVAQSQGDATQPENWKIVGVYDLDTTTVEPTEIIVLPGIFKDSINIFVDYDNPPPQPFEN